MLAIDQYIAKLANMAKIDRLAIDLAHKTDDHLLADDKAPNGLAAILLGVEVAIGNMCKDILTSF